MITDPDDHHNKYFQCDHRFHIQDNEQLWIIIMITALLWINMITVGLDNWFHEHGNQDHHHDHYADDETQNDHYFDDFT